VICAHAELKRLQQSREQGLSLDIPAVGCRVPVQESRRSRRQLRTGCVVEICSFSLAEVLRSACAEYEDGWVRTYLGELVLVAGYEVEVSGYRGGCHDGGDVEVVGVCVGGSLVGAGVGGGVKSRVGLERQWGSSSTLKASSNEVARLSISYEFTSKICRQL
jgi:hypothetical protein